MKEIEIDIIPFSFTTLLCFSDVNIYVSFYYIQ